MKPLSKANPLGLGLAAALFAIGSPVVLAQDAASEDDSDAVETIVVTGTRMEQNIEDVAGSISVMTSSDIENQMVNNMSEMFRYEPGIQITGSNGTAQNVIVRGMGGDRVMMIMDGMRMNEGYGADGANDIVGRGFIDPDLIKQVEVAKGAASSLYGADALGGIVAFATKDAADYLRDGNFGGTVKVGGDGRSNETSLGLITAFRTGMLETLIAGTTRDGNETKNYTDERPHLDVESNAVLVKSDFIIDENQKVTVSFDHLDQDVAKPDDGSPKGDYQGLTGWTINFQETASERTTDKYRLGYTNNDLELFLADNVEAFVYLNDTEQKDSRLENHETPPPFGPGGSRDRVQDSIFAQETTGVSLTAGNNIGDHYLSYGFDWDVTETHRPERETRTQSDGTVVMDSSYAPFPKSETERIGIFLVDSIRIGERLTLIPNLRYDSYEMTPLDDPLYDDSNQDPDARPQKIKDSNLSPSLGAIVDFTGNLSVAMQASQGFKVPPYDLAYIYHDNWRSFPYWYRLVPAESLVPEESESFEISLRGSFGSASYSLTAYENNYDNFIQIAYLGTVTDTHPYGFPWDVNVFQYQNIEAVEISGLEFRFDVDINENVHLFLNAEKMDGEDKSTGDNLPQIQPFKGAIGLYFTQRSFDVQAVARWAASMDKHPEGALSTGSWMTLDLFAYADLTENLSFKFGVLNALGEEYIEYSRIAGIPDDGRDLTLYTEPGIALSATIRYEF